jgi:hypothetical protein
MEEIHNVISLSIKLTITTLLEKVIFISEIFLDEGIFFSFIILERIKFDLISSNILF